MGVPILLLAVKAVTRYKLIKDVINVASRRKTDKAELILSYVPGFVGKAARTMNRYVKICKEQNTRIAKLQKIKQRLLVGAKMGDAKKEGHQWSLKKVNTYLYGGVEGKRTIVGATNLKKNWVKKQIVGKLKSKLISKIPKYYLFKSIDSFAKVCANPKSWRDVTRKFGNVLGHLGQRDFAQSLFTILKYSDLTLSSNQWWRKNSANHNALYPIVDKHCANKMRWLIVNLKDKFWEDIIDRPFYFNVNSPETQNFSQKLHKYDITNKQYTLPIRGWVGKQIQSYIYDIDTDMLTILRWITNANTDFGKNIYWEHFRTRGFLSPAELYWAMKWYENN